MTIYIETQRLILRDWIDSDLSKFQIMNQDPQVMKFFPGLLSPKQSQNFYENIIQELAETKGLGLFAVEIKKNNNFIGFTGFHKASFKSDFTPCTEIGWRLKKEAWNRGYATEAAGACLYYAAKQKKLEMVHSFTATINLPSIRVMEKIGLKFIKEFDHPNVADNSELKRHVLYKRKLNISDTGMLLV